MGEQHGQVLTRLDVAQHEEGDEDDPQPHQDREPDTVFTRLQGEPQTSPLEQSVPLRARGKPDAGFRGRRLLPCRCGRDHNLWITGSVSKVATPLTCPMSDHPLCKQGKAKCPPQSSRLLFRRRCIQVHLRCSSAHVAWMTEPKRSQSLFGKVKGF